MKTKSRRLMLSRTTVRELSTDDIAQARGGVLTDFCKPEPPASLKTTYMTGTFAFGMCQTGNATCFGCSVP